MLFFIFQSAALVALAIGIGIFAGYLLWGGAPVETDTSLDVAALSRRLKDPDAPSSEITAELEARAADVARLRHKLKRAVAELERRSTQLMAAREEHENLQMQIEALGAQLAHVQEEHTGLREIAERAVNAPVLWDSGEGNAAQVESAVRSQTLTAQLRAEGAERRATQAQARAEAAEAGIEELRSELTALQRENEGRVAALELDLASARLRSDAAAKELAQFSAELAALRDANAQHLQTTHTSMREMQSRLDVAKSALTGRAMTPTPPPPVAPADPTASLYDLLSLPGLTRELSEQLRDIGVQSVSDIAEWTPDEVDRFQAWLPDHPDVIARNDWVGAARRLVAEAALDSAVASPDSVRTTSAAAGTGSGLGPAPTGAASDPSRTGG